MFNTVEVRFIWNIILQGNIILLAMILYLFCFMDGGIIKEETELLVLALSL